ncbi:MAG: hypothetical protein EOO80_20410 [Oxalobacteraceae bacterium]|nr:MAG: hypothetical protein EOO80_20410 [Oxalobacteraceae bacterium]
MPSSLNTCDRQTVQALARVAGKTASIYGYPLVEMIRRCRAETRREAGRPDQGVPPIDTARPIQNLSQIASEARIFSASWHTIAWLYLGDGPRRLSIEGADTSTWQLAVRDAWSQCIAFLDPEVLRMGLWMVGPRATAPIRTDASLQLRCASSFACIVTHVGCVSSATSAHTPDMPLMLKIDGMSGTLNNRRPAAVELWEGDLSDPFTDLLDRGEPAEALAPRFYANLCRGLAHSPPKQQERLLIEDLRAFGLGPAGALQWTELRPAGPSPNARRSSISSRSCCFGGECASPRQRFA